MLICCNLMISVLHKIMWSIKKKKKKTTCEVKGKIADLFESWWAKMPIKGTLANTVNPDLTL